MPNFDIIVKNLANLQILHLDSVRIESVLPQALANLSSLTSLRLSFCKLQGGFPSNILNLPRLQTLMINQNPDLFTDTSKFNLSNALEVVDFSFTNLSGRLPVSFGRRTPSFRICYAEICNLYGTIPTWIWNTTEGVILSGNHFTGKLHLTVNKKELLGFTTLSLGSNLLNGTIPSWMFTLPSLESLDLDDNQLTGELDGSVLAGNSSLELVDLSMNMLSVELNIFSKFKRLKYLDLSNSRLSLIDGVDSKSTWPKLEYLGLSSCNLSEFPDFLRSQQTLEQLDLSKNKIKGEVPRWLRDVGRDSMYNLNLSYNYLTGGLELFSWKSLFIIDLRSNLLQGPLPSPPPYTNMFLASNNKFSGEIPSSFCNSTLGALDLSNNHLKGKIPKCFGKLSDTLQFLRLRSNKLYGSISMKFMEDCGLTSLDLNDNQLEGSIPRSLAKCTSLQVLNMGRNGFKGTFPHWLDTLPELKILVLRSNKFHGSIRDIPKARHPFPKLQILDLSGNRFTGKLPARYMQNFKALMVSSEGKHNKSLQYIGSSVYYQDSLVLTGKGIKLHYQRIFSLLTILDLSNNEFSGGIPDAIGPLVALWGLNLSHNHLNGQILLSLANLTSLDFLDLSSNKIDGGIPPQLVRLTFLEVFNVSSNRLVGPIPRGNQFATFSNDSYEGNSGLCGYPLPECGEKAALTPLTPVSQQGEHFLDFAGLSMWEIVMMGYGTGMILGVVGGYCMLSTGKPAWFSRKVDRIEYVMVQRSKKHFKKWGRRM